MRPLGAGLAVERLEPVKRPERQPPGGLGALRPVSTLATAGDRLSYRICRNGTPPVTSNAARALPGTPPAPGWHTPGGPPCPNTTAGTRTRSTGSGPGQLDVTSPKSTSASGRLAGLRDEHLRPPARPPRADLRLAARDVGPDIGYDMPSRSLMSASRSKIRLAVCRCLRGASRSARKIRSIASLCRPRRDVRGGSFSAARATQTTTPGPGRRPPCTSGPDPCSTVHRPGSPGGSPRRARPSTSTACTPSTTPTSECGETPGAR